MLGDSRDRAPEQNQWKDLWELAGARAGIQGVAVVVDHDVRHGRGIGRAGQRIRRGQILVADIETGTMWKLRTLQ